MKKNFIATQIIFSIISLFAVVFILHSIHGLPSGKFIKNIDFARSTQIFDINGNRIAEIGGDENRIYVPLQEISPELIRAVISSEDARFYEHRGVDLKGTLRALMNNSSGVSSVQGGSTITQQLAKNLFLIPQKSVKRKLLEALLAVKLENSYSKDEILEKYLNMIYLGNNSYGIEKAAQRYFNKSAKDLDLAESSLLAGLIKAPEIYSPYYNIAESLRQQGIVLDKMIEYGYITEKQKYLALNKHLTFASPEIAYPKYPYFVDYVAYLLRQEYGEDIVKQGGLKVYTTLDPTAQEIAEKTIIDGVKAMPQFTNIKQGALVSIDVKTGYIKAIVGGVDYAQSQFNRATLAKRPVGSGFKPVVYLTGLRLGLITPDAEIVDAPVSYRTKWNVWCPHNWDGKYLGKMTIRKALTLSRNTPTVRVALKSGIDNIIETARLLGYRSDINRGYSIVLGSAVFSPVEVATVFSTLARQGIYLEPTAIRYITDSKGNVIDSNIREPMRVVDSEPVKQLVSILVDVVEKGTGKQAKMDDRVVAGKTGTTDDFKDIWFTGFTPDTVTVVWMGNDENMALKGVFSSNCAELWKKYSEEYYQKEKIMAEPFETSMKSEIPDDKTEEKLDTPTKRKVKKRYSSRKHNYRAKKHSDDSEIKLPPRTYVPAIHNPAMNPEQTFPYSQ